MAERPRSKLFILAIAGVVIWSLLLVAGAGYVVSGMDPGPYGNWDEATVLGDGPEKVALIRIEGEIVPGRGASSVFGESFAAEDWIDQLRQAEEDDGVAAVVLQLDTPGGAVVASDDVYRAVRSLDGRKPVVALMGDVAASGGYYIAAGARSIVANQATITGSIGAVAIFLNLEGTASKVGLRPVVVKSGRHKDIGSPFRDMTVEERRIIQSLIDEAFDGFVDAVAEGRDMPEATVRKIADGRVLSGRQAMRLGLVDDLGGLEEAFATARELAHIGEDETRLVEYLRPSPGLGALLGARAPGIRNLVREAASEAGIPSRSGLHYLWIS